MQLSISGPGGNNTKETERMPALRNNSGNYSCSYPNKMIWVAVLVCMLGSSSTIVAKERHIRKGRLVRGETMGKEKTTAPFYMGVYVYDHSMAKTAQEQNIDYYAFLEKHLKILEKHGVNALHLTVTGPREDEFERTLGLLDRYGMKVIPQLNFAYFQEKWSEDEMIKYAKKAGDFIQRYIHHPQVLAWSVREEPPHWAINKLSRYYFMIREYAPEADFAILHNNLGAAKDQAVPDPAIVGTDRYAFWWEVSGGGYLASPGFALNWTRKEATRYYEQAAKRGADYWFVIYSGGYVMPGNEWVDIEKMPYPETKQEKQELSERVLRFAEQGRMGWTKVDTPSGPSYSFWKWYRMPKNCMRASAWTAVMEGARLFFCWLYQPPAKEVLDLNVRKVALSNKGDICLWTLAGRPGKPNPQLEEFAQVSQEIQQYEEIITQMHKLPASPVVCGTKEHFNRAFSFPGVYGKIIVLHNANVGTWPHNSRYFFKDNDQIFIDDDGNLVGYQGFTEPMESVFQITEMRADDRAYDLATGVEITAEEGNYSVFVAPGSGRLLFIGSEEESRKLQGLVRKNGK